MAYKSPASDPDSDIVTLHLPCYHNESSWFIMPTPIPDTVKATLSELTSAQQVVLRGYIDCS
jgi:hypothetical protein